MGHLDVLGLDAVRAGDATSEQRGHAEVCPECRAAVDGLSSLAGRLAPARVDVPPFVRARLMSSLRPRRRLLPLAAAAALFLAVASLWLIPSKPGDLDRNGEVDIVDALVMATRLKAGETIEGRHDLNGDGRIDARDIDVLAARVVAVGGGEGR